MDNRVASSSIGRNSFGGESGWRTFTHFKEGYKYRFHQRDDSNKTFPLDFQQLLMVFITQQLRTSLTLMKMDHTL